MLKAFYPDRIAESAYEIPYDYYYAQGIRGVIFDIDNTLVPHGAPADKRAAELFADLRDLGLHTCLLSNNKEPRVSPFAQAVGSPYIYKAGKRGTWRLWEQTEAPLFLWEISCSPMCTGRAGPAFFLFW